MIIPSIDIMNGKAVKLIQGGVSSKKYEKNALKLAKEYSIYPIVSVIDLDAAFGKGNNVELIKKICKICDCYIGGGIRTVEIAYEYLKMGANKIIIGTNANVEFLSKLPKEKVIAAIDSKKGKVVKNGWQKTTEITPSEKAKELDNYCSAFLYTYVDKEGTMQGIDFKTVRRLKEITNKKIIYAGGISSIEEVRELEKLEVDSVLGMALYEGKIDINEAFVSILDFKEGLIPTIVQDGSDQVLMLAYSSKESLLKALETRKGWYYSRRREKLWMKGETSGNTQDLLRVRVDCDKDTLLFIVKQTNVACHTGSYSCFESKRFNIKTLYGVVDSKKNTCKGYTDKLLNNKALLMEKILEESGEVVNFSSKENLVWEIADLLYFITVLMAREGIDYSSIEKELYMRNLKKNLNTG